MQTSVFILFMIVYLAGFAFFTYYCLIADPGKSRTAFYLTVELPAKISNKVASWLGKKFVNQFAGVMEYSLALIYLVVVLGSWSIIFAYAYPWVDESPHVSSYHKYIGVIVFLICMTSWRYSSMTSPGIITAKTIPKYDNYPYDEVIFFSGNICKTVGIRKLARSKFDRFSGIHIARFDHFCGWLHNPIGEENYRWFLLFLLVHFLMCLYGTVVCGILFQGEVVDKKLWEVTFYNVPTGNEFRADYYVVFQYLFQRHSMVAGVFLLMAVMTIVLGGFLTWHVWISSRGMTTNESVKWDQVRKWHKQTLKRYKQAIKDGLVTPDGAVVNKSKPNVSDDGDVTCTGGKAPEVVSKDEDELLCMDPGPMPRNIYNRGIIENWKEIIFPLSLREEAIDRYRKSLGSQPATQADVTNATVSSKPKAS